MLNVLSGYKNSLNFKADLKSDKKNNENQSTSSIKHLSTTSKTMIGLTALGVASAAVVSIRSKKPQLKKDDFQEFMRVIKELGISKSEDIAKNCTEKNILGTGANSTVYKFTHPKLDNWAIKVITKNKDYQSSFSKDIQESVDQFKGLNMGQEIGHIGDSVLILKRINGKPHSIADWSTRRRDGIEITKEEANNFLENIRTISEFPQSTFNNYAQKLKVLEDKGYKADSFNPNNYLIDYKNKDIHIIDAYSYAPDANMNSKYDLICPLIDYPNYESYHKVMSSSQKEEYSQITKKIASKCSKAAEENGIDCSESKFREFISRVDSRENNGGRYTSSFNKMKELSNIE